MITSIKEYVSKNYPEVIIVSYAEVEPTLKPNEEVPSLKFYDVTFEYNGKRFVKLFHTRLQETIEEQFKEALIRSHIQITNIAEV